MPFSVLHDRACCPSSTNGLSQIVQDKCEPPVYVSDRRFMKSINMLQVAAFADGRSQVVLQCQLQTA